MSVTSRRSKNGKRCDLMSSKKIRGITVQLGGDTSGLTKALSSADSALRATQRELTAVQSGLKLDPNNAVLMAQKQELLTKAISDTSDKLKALEENQEKAKRAFEANAEWERKYAPLKAQIDAASASLKDLKAKQDEAKKAFKDGNISAEDYEKVKADVKEAEKALADLRKQKGELEKEFKDGHITADQYREYQREVENTRSQLTALQRELSDTGVSAEEAHKKLGEFGDHAKTAFKDVMKAAAAVTAAVLAIGKQALETGTEFDSSMSQVAATLGYSTDELNDSGSEAAETFDTLRKFAREMGADTAFSANEAAQALNYMALAGYDADTSMRMLPNVLNLAAAGSIELAAASDMVTDAQTALGLSTEETEALVDKMAATASNSNTSVGQLGEAILTIGATARTIKGGTTELTEELGLLADNGIKGAEGGTKLRNIILALQSPTNKAAAELEKLGVNAYDSDGNFRSLEDTFGDLNIALGNMSEQDAAIAKSTIFSKRDFSAVNALLGTNKARWDELGEAIEDSTGAAKDMADVQLDNLAGDVTLFKSAVSEAEITVSDKLTPSLRNAVQFGTKAVTELAEGFGEGGLSGAVEAAHQLIERELGEQAKLIFGVETGVKAATAAFVTYKATMLLAEGISALKTVNTLLAQGKTLTEALNATAAVNPYVLIATAAIAAGVAIKSLIDIQTDLIEEAADSYDLLSDKQKKTVDGVENLAKTVRDSRKKWNENREALEKQAASAKGLSEELYRLDEQEQLSNADKEKMKAIVNELNSSVDGLNIKLDEQTGHLITQKSTIDALISSYQRQAIAAAAQERLTELYKQQFEAEKNLEQATRDREGAYNTLGQKQLELAAAQREYNELLAQDTGTIFSPVSMEQLAEAAARVETLTQEVSDQKDVVGELNTSFVSATETSKSLESGITEMTSILVANGETVQTAADGVSGSFDQVGDSAESAGVDIAAAFDETAVKTALDKVQSIIDDYNTKLETHKGTLQNWFAVNATISADEADFGALSSALDQQIADMEEWEAGIATLSDEGINKNFLEQLRDAGPSSLAYVRTLLDVPQKDRNEYAKKWDKAYKSAAEVAEKQLEETKQISERKIGEIVNGLDAYGVDFEAVGHNLGIDFSNGYINALNGATDEIFKQAQAMADAANSGVAEGQDSASPSKTARKLGNDYGDGYVLGMDDRVQNAVRAAQELVNGAIDSSRKAVKSAELTLPSSGFAEVSRAADSAYSTAQQAFTSAKADQESIKQAFREAAKELSSGNVTIPFTIDGETIARAVFPKIDLLQGQSTLFTRKGYAGV